MGPSLWNQWLQGLCLHLGQCQQGLVESMESGSFRCTTKLAFEVGQMWRLDQGLIFGMGDLSD